MENYKPQTRNDVVFGCLSNLARAYDTIGQSEIFFDYETPLGQMLIEANQLDKNVVTKYRYGFKGYNVTFVSLLDVKYDDKGPVNEVER